MARVNSVIIRRFKRLQEASIHLTDATLIIGANNSGKSSILQAVHFAVSLAQSAKLVGGVSWQKNKYVLSFSPSQLLYSPVADVISLATGGTLVEDEGQRVEITISNDVGQTCTVGLKRGRNRNIAVTIEGKELGEQLQNIQTPFSVYAPGLAGVPKEEEYLSPGVVRRFVARGDANLVLRNVLLMLSKNVQAWTQFMEDIRDIFPVLDLKVNFNDETDEFIKASFRSNDGPWLPLDAAGTSILQTTQILSYVGLFRPKILVLDEPDSHLDPNNQRSLCSLISKLTQTRGVQAVLSTHSRHVLDSMRSNCSIVWMSKGSIVESPDSETTSILLELGALDSVDYFADGHTRCIVATEDDNTDFLEVLLWSSGFNRDDTEVVSYSGCTNVDAALVLGRFLRDKAPHIHMVVHRDWDYMDAAEIERFRDVLARHGIDAFVTQLSDVEGYYLNAAHLALINPTLGVDRTNELIEQATTDKRQSSIAAIINCRTQEAYRRRNRDGTGGVDAGQIGTKSHTDYDADPSKMRRGKEVLKRLRELLQQELKANPQIVSESAQLSVPELRTVAQRLFGQKPDDSQVVSDDVEMEPGTTANGNQSETESVLGVSAGNEMMKISQPGIGNPRQRNDGSDVGEKKSVENPKTFEGKVGKWYVTIGDEPFEKHRVPDHESDTQEEARNWLGERKGQIWEWPPLVETNIAEIDGGHKL
jgi:ABC-type cobalamin/Fe3+-siderophores transport system ATPase subunit